MITALTDQYIAREVDIKAAIAGSKETIGGYETLLKLVLPFLDVPNNGHPDEFSTDIDTLDHGNYQGTLVLIFHEDGYQPSRYFATKASYGSCSYCDTMQSILYDYEDDDPDPDPKRFTETQVDLLYTEGLHLMQATVEV